MWSRRDPQDDPNSGFGDGAGEGCLTGAPVFAGTGFLSPFSKSTASRSRRATNPSVHSRFIERISAGIKSNRLSVMCCLIARREREAVLFENGLKKPVPAKTWRRGQATFPRSVSPVFAGTGFLSPFSKSTASRSRRATNAIRPQPFHRTNFCGDQVKPLVRHVLLDCAHFGVAITGTIKRRASIEGQRD